MLERFFGIWYTSKSSPVFECFFTTCFSVNSFGARFVLLSVAGLLSAAGFCVSCVGASCGFSCPAAGCSCAAFSTGIVASFCSVVNGFSLVSTVFSVSAVGVGVVGVASAVLALALSAGTTFAFGLRDAFASNWFSPSKPNISCRVTSPYPRDTYASRTVFTPCPDISGVSYACLMVVFPPNSFIVSRSDCVLVATGVFLPGTKYCTTPLPSWYVGSIGSETVFFVPTSGVSLWFFASLRASSTSFLLFRSVLSISSSLLRFAAISCFSTSVCATFCCTSVLRISFTTWSIVAFTAFLSGSMVSATVLTSFAVSSIMVSGVPSTAFCVASSFARFCSMMSALFSFSVSLTFCALSFT